MKNSQLFAGSNPASRVSRNDTIGLNVFGDDCLCPNHSVLPNFYAGQDHCPHPYERTFLDGNLSSNQLKGGIVEVVCSSTEIGFLGNCGTFHNLDRSK
jgi:hypothetical protein